MQCSSAPWWRWRWRVVGDGGVMVGDIAVGGGPGALTATIDPTRLRVRTRAGVGVRCPGWVVGGRGGWMGVGMGVHNWELGWRDGWVLARRTGQEGEHGHHEQEERQEAHPSRPPHKIWRQVPLVIALALAVTIAFIAFAVAFALDRPAASAVEHPLAVRRRAARGARRCHAARCRSSSEVCDARGTDPGARNQKIIVLTPVIFRNPPNR